MDDNKRIIRVALLQLKIHQNRFENLQNAEYHIQEAKQNDAQLVVLPECFNSPYGVEFFNEYAEPMEGPTCKMLAKAAKENSIYLVGGTFPEKENGNLYNTCTVWNPNGEMIAKYRKTHLFEINIPGKINFKESDALTPGSDLTTFYMNDTKIGLGICHDLRFDELAKSYRLQNCDVLIYPAAFNMATGAMHVELLQRSRAVDNQVFVIGVSTARAETGYIAWGHSQVTSPWGKVLVQAGYKQEVIYCDLDLKLCDEVRHQILIFPQRRTDLYNTIFKSS